MLYSLIAFGLGPKADSLAESLILAILLIGPGHYQDGGDEKLKITVIQPLTTNMERIINMTNEAESDLVIWPEAVTKFDENVSKLVPQKVVIGGFFRQENTNVYTSAINLKTGHHYDKRNLVPFGEFQPFGSLLKSKDKKHEEKSDMKSKGTYYTARASQITKWEASTYF